MIKERSDFFQNAKFFPILNIYNSPDDQCIQICMNSKFDAILQPVLSTLFPLISLFPLRPQQTVKICCCSVVCVSLPVLFQ